MDFYALVEKLFAKELKTAEWAQSNLDIVRALLAKARENGTNEERVAFRWAERGVETWQKECFEHLGRAVFEMMRDKKTK